MNALRDASLDQFLMEKMHAQENVRLKCRNNYRHMFHLCGYMQSRLSIINTRAEKWIGSALFLVWDRHILDGGAQAKSDLLRLIDSEELYKLLGVTRLFAVNLAEPLAELYETVGRLDRFNDAANVRNRGPIERQIREVETTYDADLGWLQQEMNDGVVERRSIARQEQVRDRKISVMLKRNYGNTCQFCGTKLQISDEEFYSEAAHIKGLGAPHNGPDVANNMLVLCPNHHLQFDRGVLRLCKVGNDYYIRSKEARDPIHGRRIALIHTLDEQYVKYHYEWFR